MEHSHRETAISFLLILHASILEFFFGRRTFPCLPLVSEHACFRPCIENHPKCIENLTFLFHYTLKYHDFIGNMIVVGDPEIEPLMGFAS